MDCSAVYFGERETFRSNISPSSAFHLDLLIYCLAYISSVKVEAVRSSETYSSV